MSIVKYGVTMGIHLVSNSGTRAAQGMGGWMDRNLASAMQLRIATRLSSLVCSTAVALSLLISLAPLAANSTVIEIPADAQQTLWAENQSGSDPWFYTHATETWSFSTNITGRFLSLGSTSPGVFIDDLGGGAYTVSAHIDHDGNVLGGAFSWVSQSVTLGVLAPQIFLSGTILGAVQEDSGGVVQLWASVDYTNPAIAAQTIAPNFAALSFIGGPCWLPCETLGGFNAFAQDGQGVVIQPDIFGYHIAIDEPTLPILAWLILAAIAASGYRVPRRAGRSDVGREVED